MTLERPLHFRQRAPPRRSWRGQAALRRDLQTAAHAGAQPLCMRLDQERAKHGNPLHGVLAQRVEHAVVRAGCVHPREEHGGRRHIERRRQRAGRSSRLGDREDQRAANRRLGRSPRLRAIASSTFAIGARRLPAETMNLSRCTCPTTLRGKSRRLSSLEGRAEHVVCLSTDAGCLARRWAIPRPCGPKDRSESPQHRRQAEESTAP